MEGWFAKMNKITTGLLAMLLLLGLCSCGAAPPDEAITATDMPRTETLFSNAAPAQRWFDWWTMLVEPEETEVVLTVPEFPGVTFRVTQDQLSDGTDVLFWGMPIHQIYLADLNGDGKPEFCAAVSVGSGISDDRVIVFDYANRQEYDLSDRTQYDYRLQLRNGRLFVSRTSSYLSGGNAPALVFPLELVNDAINKPQEATP